MTAIDLRFLRVAVLYALLGMAIGLAMGISGDHRFYPAHAHMNLIGWVSLALYGLAYRAYPQFAQSRLALLHFWLANIGAFLLPIGVAGINAGHEAFEPVAGAGAIGTILGASIFAVLLFRTCAEQSNIAAGPTLSALRVDAIPGA